MKRLLAGVLMLVALAACGQTVLYRTSGVLEWDAVTTYEGRPLLPGDSVAYEVYFYDSIIGVADPQNVALLTLMGTTSVAQLAFTMPYRTWWAAGVRTRMVDGGGTLIYSSIAWSYLAEDADPVLGPFVYAPDGQTAPLQKPKTLRDSGT